MVFFLRISLIMTMLGSCLGKEVAAAEVYPAKSIELIVPAAKGGGADLSFRALATAMESILRQPINVVNIPKDGGAEALQALARAKPDGYTLGGVWNSPLTASPQVRAVPYSFHDYALIASVFASDYVLCVHQDRAISSAADLIALLRSNPFSFTYGTEGRGGVGYFAAEAMFEKLGLFLRSEDYSNSVEVARGFSERKVDFYLGTVSAILPRVKNHEAKCLITLAAQRMDVMPGATPSSELGITQKQPFLWRLVIAPKQLPAEKRAKLEMAVRAAMASPQVQQFLLETGERAFFKTGRETGQMLEAEFALFASLAENLGFKSD